MAKSGQVAVRREAIGGMVPRDGIEEVVEVARLAACFVVGTSSYPQKYPHTGI
jgi:hypothetical protein